MSAARAPWACATLDRNPLSKGKGWRVTKFHSQAAWKTRCEQTAPRRRDPTICCRGAAGRRRGSPRARRGQGSTSNATEGVPENVWEMLSRLPRCRRGISALTERSVPLAPGLHTSLDTSPLSYRCCAAFGMEPPTIQLFEHMCIFHSANRKNKAAGLQRLDPRARMREAGEVFLWEISVVFPVVSL